MSAAGDNTPPRLYWHLLSHAEQAEVVKRMASSGMSDHGIAHATELSVEQIRQILGEQRQ